MSGLRVAKAAVISRICLEEKTNSAARGINVTAVTVEISAGDFRSLKPRRSEFNADRGAPRRLQHRASETSMRLGAYPAIVFMRGSPLNE
jgi:hypothetical protein